jgi:hypothetical protein
MSKYDPLTTHLTARNSDYISMSFTEIEQQLGFALPDSSRKHRAWWSNNPSNNVMTKAWLAAGYETAQVDLVAEKLQFVRDNSTPPTGAPTGAHPIFGCMKGTVTIPDTVDLTAPAEPEWGDIAGNAQVQE